MSTHDKLGRPYARLSELKVGDTIEVDGGFTCIPEGAKREVLADDKGELYILCGGSDERENATGDDTRSSPQVERHALDGQADDGEHCIGVYRA